MVCIAKALVLGTGLRLGLDFALRMALCMRMSMGIWVYGYGMGKCVAVVILGHVCAALIATATETAKQHQNNNYKWTTSLFCQQGLLQSNSPESASATAPAPVKNPVGSRAQGLGPVKAKRAPARVLR